MAGAMAGTGVRKKRGIRWQGTGVPFFDGASPHELASFLREVPGRDGRWREEVCKRLDSFAPEEVSAEVVRLIDDHYAEYEYHERAWLDWREIDRISGHIGDVVRVVARPHVKRRDWT